jgi:type I restriction enzyme M protein
MANPPFNVNKVDKGKDYVKTDKRLPFGLPKTDNGNYLWIQYFYSYLNETGRAGFVMASSATDAGHSEAAIREKLIATNHVDCVVGIGNNFFYTRSLPCHLWFFDKGKSKANAERILMIDARNVYRKVNSTINDFSIGQLLNLTTIMKLYRGEKNTYKNAYAEHQQMLFDLLSKISWYYTTLANGMIEAAKELKIEIIPKTEIKINKPTKHEEAENIFNQFNLPIETATVFITMWQEQIEAIEKKIADEKVDEKEGKKQIQVLRSKIATLNKPITNYTNETKEYYEQTKQGIIDWKQFMDWFPDGNYQDIEGLCKVVSLEEVKKTDSSLTPGRYVGVVATENDATNFTERLSEIKAELSVLDAEALKLSNIISNNLAQLI